MLLPTDTLNVGNSYCALVCCDGTIEETCADYDDNGNIKQFCAAVRYLLRLLHISRRITFPNSYFLAQLSDGGCPCPPGQKRCNAGTCRWIYLNASSHFLLNSPFSPMLSDPWTGATSYCAMVCCTSSEETCSYYDKEGNVNQYCALVSTHVIQNTMSFLRMHLNASHNINWSIIDRRWRLSWYYRSRR